MSLLNFICIMSYHTKLIYLHCVNLCCYYQLRTTNQLSTTHRYLWKNTFKGKNKNKEIRNFVHQDCFNLLMLKSWKKIFWLAQINLKIHLVNSTNGPYKEKSIVQSYYKILSCLLHIISIIYLLFFLCFHFSFLNLKFWMRLIYNFQKYKKMYDF